MAYSSGGCGFGWAVGGIVRIRFQGNKTCTQHCQVATFSYLVCRLPRSLRAVLTTAGRQPALGSLRRDRSRCRNCRRWGFDRRSWGGGVAQANDKAVAIRATHIRLPMREWIFIFSPSFTWNCASSNKSAFRSNRAKRSWSLPNMSGNTLMAIWRLSSLSSAR